MAQTHFKVHQPTSLEQAMGLMKDLGADAKYLCGGTDLVPKLKEGILKTGNLVSLKAVPGLDQVAFDADGNLVIGGTALLSQVAETPKVDELYPGLAYACSVMATTQIRNMGSVAGNIANSAPSADTAAPLLVYDAVINAVGQNGKRSIAIAEFFTGPGMNVLEPGEIIESITLPAPTAPHGSVYLRLSARSEVDIAAVGVAAFVGLGADGKVDRCRLALAAVAATPRRATEAEDMLIGQAPDEALIAKAAEAAREASKPIDDVRASAAYRRTMVEVLAGRALTQSLSAAQGGAK